MSLPETSTEDLRRMGITPQAIKEKAERNRAPIKGDIVGYFLPGDGWDGRSNIRRARNNMKHDWHSITETPRTDIIKVEEYNQKFLNFDGDESIEFTFSHSVQVITADDYTQTRRFEVSVNAVIPLGQSGALVGFHAAMSGDDVKSKSKSETETRENQFPLTVPAGEGRQINEKTIVKSKTVLFESALRVEGSVGIEVDPGPFEPNIVYVFPSIEFIFPDAAATSRISRSSTNTDIENIITKILPPDANGAEIVEYHSSNSDVAAAGFELEGPVIALSPTVKDSPPGLSAFPASMKVEVQFAGVKPEVPLQKRQGGMEHLRALIVTDVHPIGNPSAISYTPNFAPASFSIPYDPQHITNAQLGTAVINEANRVQWGGKFVIYFS